MSTLILLLQFRDSLIKHLQRAKEYLIRNKTHMCKGVVYEKKCKGLLARFLSFYRTTVIYLKIVNLFERKTGAY